jgi:hypothetical protein
LSECGSVAYFFSILLSAAEAQKVHDHLPVTDLFRVPRQLFHLLCRTPADHSGSVSGGPPVRLVPQIGEGTFAWTSNRNVPAVPKFCLEFLRPGRFLPPVFTFAGHGPVVSYMPHVLVRFSDAISSAREMDRLIFIDCFPLLLKFQLFFIHRHAVL